MDSKICLYCNIDKEISDFQKNKERILSICKKCNKEKMHNYYLLNKQKIIERSKKYNLTHKEAIVEYKKQYFILNREKIKSKYIKYFKVYKEKNLEKIQEYHKLYRLKNIEKIRKNYLSYVKNRKKIDPLFKLKCDIRCRILNSIKTKYTKKSKTLQILGCSFEEFKIYIENKFDKNMNWTNHGTYWHYDHIKPISLATNEDKMYRLNHYTNFQPLHWKENIIKLNKY